MAQRLTLALVLAWSVVFLRSASAQAEFLGTTDTSAQKVLKLAKAEAPIRFQEPPKRGFFAGPPKPAWRFTKREFYVLSAAVYAMAFLDMHETLRVRNDPGWYETDPFAKPFAKFPRSAYYLSGAVFYTGVNWFSWRMAHSDRWRKFSRIPQFLSMIGNANGLRTNYPWDRPACRLASPGKGCLHK